MFALTSGLGALATTSQQLIAARALMGIGAALIFPATLAIIINVFKDPKERATAIGIWSAMVGVAVAIGPIAGGYLLEHFAWNSIFLVNIPIAFIAILLGMKLLPESRDLKIGKIDVKGLILSFAGVGLVIWGVIEGPKLGWLSPLILLAIIGGIVILGFFTWLESRLTHPMLNVHLFKNPRFTASSFSIATAFFALFGFIFLITQFLQLVQGYSPLEAGVRTLPFAAATGLASPLAIVLMHRFGTKVIVSFGLITMAVGFLIAASIKFDSPYLGVVLISMVTIATGLGLATSPATDAIMGSLPEDQAGSGAAVNDTTRELGGTLGVALVGSIFLSVYKSKVVEISNSLGLPSEIRSIAQDSLGSGLAVANQFPSPQREQMINEFSKAFIDGLSRGSIVAAIVVACGALGSWFFLPARVSTIKKK